MGFCTPEKRPVYKMGGGGGGGEGTLECVGHEGQGRVWLEGGGIQILFHLHTSQTLKSAQFRVKLVHTGICA